LDLAKALANSRHKEPGAVLFDFVEDFLDRGVEVVPPVSDL